MVVEQHKTIIITTHYIEEANLANRVSTLLLFFLYICVQVLMSYIVV